MLFAQHEITNVPGFISRFYTTLGERNVRVDVEALEGVLTGIREHLDADNGVDAASPFKKAATFVCHFVEACPVKTRLPRASALARAIRQATGSRPDQNAVIALRIAMESLHGATVRRTDGLTVELSRRLDLSKHSYVDIVDALSEATPAHYKYVAVLLEQLAYKTNPRCQYASYQIAGFDGLECNLEPIIGHDDLMDLWTGRAHLEVVRRPPRSLHPEEVTSGMEKSRASGDFQSISTHAPFRYQRSRTDPELVDRVAADGTVTTGRVHDGIFLEASADDAS